MGVGFTWLYISIAIIAILAAVIVWFTTKNIWASIVVIGLFGILVGVIILSTVFANPAPALLAMANALL